MRKRVVNEGERDSISQTTLPINWIFPVTLSLKKNWFFVDHELAKAYYTKECTNSRPPVYSLALKSDGLRQTANNGKSNGWKLNA